MTEKQFKPPFVRDRKVILSDIAYAESILKRNPNDEELKQTIKELNEELNDTSSSIIVDFGLFVYLFLGILLLVCVLKKFGVI